MNIVKVSSGDKDLSKLLLRQTPGCNGIWGNCRFYVNEDIDQCDWWVVCHGSGLKKIETTICDPSHSPRPGFEVGA